MKSDLAAARARIHVVALAFAGVLFVLAPCASAQMMAMGPPIPTTVVVMKPAPGQVFGDQQVVSFGVKNKTYRFILKDAYVDDPRQVVHWIDIWQQVQQYRPNFQTQGMNSDVFEKLEPGQTLTVKGMYAPLNQTFEVVSTDVGGGVFQPPSHY
jgi:hypothetical protein